MYSSKSSSPHFRAESALLSDTGLLAAARTGSEIAFTELHRLYARRLYRTILSITKNHEDAEDALQDTMMRAYVGLSAFEGRSKILSWMTRIAINSALIILRKRSTQRVAKCESLSRNEDEAPHLRIKDPGRNPEEVCLHRERHLRLTHEVAELHPLLRTAMQMQIDCECSLREIAESLDVPVATVKARLHRARGRLATRMQSRL